MKRKPTALTALIIAVVLFLAFVPEPASAQYIVYTQRCCDGAGYVRCFINPTPVGNSCYCYGQGWGYAC